MNQKSRWTKKLKQKKKINDDNATIKHIEVEIQQKKESLIPDESAYKEEIEEQKSFTNPEVPKLKKKSFLR